MAARLTCNLLADNGSEETRPLPGGSLRLAHSNSETKAKKGIIDAEQPDTARAAVLAQPGASCFQTTSNQRLQIL